MTRRDIFSLNAVGAVQSQREREKEKDKQTAVCDRPVWSVSVNKLNRQHLWASPPSQQQLLAVMSAGHGAINIPASPLPSLSPPPPPQLSSLQSMFQQTNRSILNFICTLNSFSFSIEYFNKCPFDVCQNVPPYVLQRFATAR